ncbi:MAG: hypothetical protein R3206_09440 [Salegentibacter mishustinae]|nr:hypothetical protein [Salegentibacter mishustinae]
MVSSTKITRHSIINDLQVSARKHYPAFQDLHSQTFKASEKADQAKKVLKESLSLLSTSAVTALGIFGLELSILNSIILGLIVTLLVLGFFKPIFLSLGILCIGILILFSDCKLVAYGVYFAEQLIIFFSLREGPFFDNGIVSYFINF